MGDVEARASPPPLLAFTATKQKQKLDKNGRREKTPRRVKPGVSTTYKTTANTAPPRPRMRKPEGTIVFDDSSRREYLTGFHKRKQAKITKGKEKAKERAKQEHRLMRQEMREAQKKQAAENVDAEKKAYGDEGEGEVYTDDSEEEEDGKVPSLPSAYDTEQHHTTITVQEWDPEKGESKAKEPRKPKVVKEALPPSSRRMAKKLKNGQGFVEVREISKLMESEDALPSLEEEVDMDDGQAGGLAVSQEAGENNKGYSSYAKTKKVRKPTFRYESKMERAKNKAQARESKSKWAEKRREERIGGGGKGRMQKNKGKRGHGGKGSKKK